MPAKLCVAQGALDIYTDQFVNGFDDWSWATHNNANTSPVHSGIRSMSVSANYWEGISFHHSDFDTSTYEEFSFWAHGGTAGGQRLQVYGELSAIGQPAVTLPPLTANTWQEFVIPLSALNLADKPNLSRLNIQLRADGTSGIFYLDDVRLTAKPPPTAVNVTVNATQTVRQVEGRWFGVNTAIWDGDFDTPQTVSLLREMNTRGLRFPGGSLSDEYHWGSNKSLNNTWEWVTSFTDFIRVATNAGIEDVFITVNYGSGTAEEAAAWVRHANVTNQLGFKYWEIGNENYGTWERDTNALPNHAYTYAVRAAQYFSLMKAADPSIKIGMPVSIGEDAYSNGYTDHPAFNPRTEQTHHGWTPVLLSTLKTLGVMPDFLVHHHYPQWTDPNNPQNSPDDDASLLQSTDNWSRDAANLRQQISDYFGPAGTNIELVVTENNSDAGAQGRQSTSLVNGLYYADSLGELMKTEFNAFVWWDLRNGTDPNGFFGSSIYGWRNYGDLGMVNSRTNRHPTFYAAKLMSYLATPEDAVIEAESDYSLISAHAVRRANGGLSLLLLNKSKLTALTANIELDGYNPDSRATIFSYGIPQDEAARTNAPYHFQDVATNSFTGASSAFSHNLPPLSLTLFTFKPAAPILVPLIASSPEEFVFQLQGQAGGRYIIESSTNLTDWIPIATNSLDSNSLSVTNAVAAESPQKYWRAVWQP